MTCPLNSPTDFAPPAAFGRDAWTGRLFRWLAAGLIVAAGLVAYHNSLAGPFLFDDPAAITNNPTIRQLHWRSLGNIFRTPGGAGPIQNRPVVNLTLAINYALGGERVWGYHAVNLAIHLAAGLILFGLARRTFRLPRMPQSIRSAADLLGFATALVWIVHPLGTESVTYVVERTESLMAMFYLLTLYGLLVGATATSRAGRAGGFAVSVAACATGMGCKEVMVTAPVIALAYDSVFISGSWRETLRRRWKLHLALATTWGVLAAAIASSGPRFHTSIFDQGVTVRDYACTQFGAVVTYLKLSVWPSPLIASYGDTLAHSAGEILPPAVAVGLLIALTIWALIRWPMVGFIGVWMFVILAPTSSILPLPNEPIAERRMYLPLAGLVAGAVAMAYWFGQRALERLGVGRWGRRAIGLTVLAGVVAPFAWLTVSRNRDYQSEMALYQDTVNKRPSNHLAINNLGVVYAGQGDFDKAIGLCSKAIELAPRFAVAYCNRANVYAEKGDFTKALADCDRAIELDPRHALAHDTRGSVYGRMGDTEAALADYTKAIELDPRAAQTYFSRGVVYGRKGDLDRAIADYDKAIELDPRLSIAYNNRGNACVRTDDISKAIADYTIAIELNPRYANAYYNRGVAYDRNGEFDKAIADYTAAIDLDPQAAQTYGDRARSYLMKADYARAWADVKECRARGGNVEPDFLQKLRQASSQPD